MSDDTVRNESKALRELKGGVLRFAEQMREAIAGARRELVDADRRAQALVDQRRAAVQRAQGEVQRAHAASSDRSRDPAATQQQIKVAREWHAEATRQLEQARRAAQTVASAQADLARALQRTEAAIGENASIAASAIATLDAKLAQLPNTGTAAGLRHAVHGLIVTGEIVGATAGLARLAGNTLQAADISTPVADHNLVQMVEHDHDQAVDYVIEQTAKRPESTGGSQETIA